MEKCFAPNKKAVFDSFDYTIRMSFIPLDPFKELFSEYKRGLPQNLYQQCC